jgi:hypothetical protein
MAPAEAGNGTGTTNILLDNVAFSDVTTPVKDSSGNMILTGENPLIVDIWALGDSYYNSYSPENPDALGMQFSTGTSETSSRSPTLVVPNTGGSGTGYANDWYCTRDKPQYETYSASDFINMKNYAAG